MPEEGSHVPTLPSGGLLQGHHPRGRPCGLPLHEMNAMTSGDSHAAVHVRTAGLREFFRGLGEEGFEARG